MPSTFNLRRGLIPPFHEPRTALPSATTSGSFTVQTHRSNPLWLPLYHVSATDTRLYDPALDSMLTVRASGIPSNTAGSCGAWNPNGPTGLCGSTGHGANTIGTTYLSTANAAGYTIRLLSGTGAGQERTISSHLIGANTVFTVSSNWTTQPDATTTWVIRSGRYYLLGGGSLAAGSFKYYDALTDTYSGNLSVAGITSPFATDGAMCAPVITQFAAGTATAGGASTISRTGSLSWTVNQWKNFQIRMLTGASAGQIRTISSNTATQITVSAAWVVQPVAGDTYVIEANENHIYLIGNASTTIYRYTISTDTWAVVTVGVARAAAPGTGLCLLCVDEEPEPAWASEAAILNGRRLYSFRGGGSSSIDYFDIADEAWTNGVSDNGGVTVSIGAMYCYLGGSIYFGNGISGSGNSVFYGFSPSENRRKPWASITPLGGGVLAVGNRMFACATVLDGVTVDAVYYMLTGTVTQSLFRIRVPV